MIEAEVNPEPVVLVLAPHGRDAAVASALLGEVGLRSTICMSLETLAEAVGPETGFVVMTEEAARGGDLAPLKAWVEAQPS